MTIFVFLGPTLPEKEARGLLDGDVVYLPPVKAGDVATLLEQKPEAIAIIDGLFEQVPSVRHKEILHALARGVRVFGASSMGALRAAELAAFGMEGVGAIFEGFRDGTYEDDDEVTVVHGPAEYGYPPFSEAMVNLRAGLALALARGHVSRDTHDRLVEMSKARFYPDRTWESLHEDLRALGATEVERAAVVEIGRTRPNAKADDARQLLRHVAAERARGMRPHVPNFAIASVPGWLAMITRPRA